MKRAPLIIAATVTCTFAVLMVIQLNKSSGFMKKSYDDKKKELYNKTKQASQVIDDKLMGFKKDVDSLAAALSIGDIGHDSAMWAIKKKTEANPLLCGAAIAYEPYKHKGDKRLFAPIYTEDIEGGVTKHQIEDSYDYTDPGEPKAQWYYSTISRGACWGDPFFEYTSKNLLFSYSAPFTFANSKVGDYSFSGIVIFFFSVDYFSGLLKSMDMGPSGYGSIVSCNGKYVVHPKDNYILEGKTVYQIGIENDDPQRLRWWNLRHKQESGIWDHISTTTKKKSFFIFAPLLKTHFCLHNTFLKDDIVLDYDAIRHRHFSNVIHFILFFSSMLIAFLVYKGLSLRNVWISVALFSIILIAAIGYVWYLAIEYPSKKKMNSDYIINESTRAKKESLLDNHYLIYGDTIIYKIPTGIFVKDITFTDNSSMTIIGTAWQKFDVNLPEKIPKEIVFPAAEVIKLTHYTQKTKEDAYKKHTLHSWDFKISLKQNFENLEYPLNYERIQVELHQKSSKYKVIPSPDVEAYKLTTPTSKLGIRKELEIPGWKIIESSFSLATKNLNTDFGVDVDISQNYYPTLNFNITIKRKFLDVFISNLTPLILVLLLLFLGLNISNVSDKYKILFKVDMPKMITFFSGLLFVVVFAHVGIRTKVDAEGLFLLEYFYLISYVAFLYVTLIIILYSSEIKIGLISYKNNLFYKALFWPLILTAILIVSISIFY